MQIIVGDPVTFDDAADQAAFVEMQRMPGMFDPTYNVVFDVVVNKNQPPIYGAGNGTGTGRSHGVARATKSHNFKKAGRGGLQLTRRSNVPLVKNNMAEASLVEFPDNEDAEPAQQTVADEQGR